MAYQNPSVADFKSYFSRDFPYSDDPEEGVTDTDIAKAFQQTNIRIAVNLLTSQDEYTVAYYYLSAHYLVTAMQQSSQGIAGQGTFIMENKSVGNVSAGYAVPDKYKNNPWFLWLSKTPYGQQYLQMIETRMIGTMFVVPGITLP